MADATGTLGITTHLSKVCSVLVVESLGLVGVEVGVGIQGNVHVILHRGLVHSA